MGDFIIHIAGGRRWGDVEDAKGRAAGELQPEVRGDRTGPWEVELTEGLDKWRG